MGAVVHDPDDALPVIVTVDTSFAVAVFNSEDAHHRLAWALYERLRAERTVVVICRPLLQIEYWSALRKLSQQLRPRQLERLVAEAEDRLGPGQRRLGLRTLDRSDSRAVRRFLLALGERLLWNSLAFLRTAEYRLSAPLIKISRVLVADYGLNSHDALFLALARRVAEDVGTEPHLAAFDGDFEKVDGLHVWTRSKDGPALPAQSAG